MGGDGGAGGGAGARGAEVGRGVDHVALWRGVNVGTAKRLPMAELRATVAALGWLDPATLLNSGNLVATTDGPVGPDDVAALRAAVLRDSGVDAAVVVLAGAEFARLAAADPLRRDGRPPTLRSTAFAQVCGALAGVAPPDVDLGDEQLVVTPDAIYQWLPHGVLASRVPAAWWRALPVPVTARNGATVQKIVDLLARRAVSRP